MPFKSQAQRRYLYATNPAVAAEFQAVTPKGARLPKRAKPKAKARIDAKANRVLGKSGSKGKK